MTTDIRVLHVDDDGEFLELTATFLDRDHDIEVVSVTDAEAALGRLEDGDIDCVVSDYEMPPVDGLEFFDLVREIAPDLPFILYTGKGSEEVASEALSAGVTDYLRKEPGPGQYEVLANRVTNAVSRRRAERGRRRSERRYRDLVDITPTPIGIHVPGEGFVYVNDALVAFLGATDEAAVLGTGPSEHVGEGATVRERVDRVHRTREQATPTEVQFVGSGEQTRYARMTLAPVLFDGRDAVEVVLNDVTAYKRREGFPGSDSRTADEYDGVDGSDGRPVRPSDEETTALLDGLADAVVVVQASTCVYANERASELFSVTAVDLVGADLADLVAPTDRDAVVDQFGSASGGVPERSEFHVETADGRLPVEATATRVNVGGEPAVALSVRSAVRHRERDRELEQYRTLVETSGDPMYILDDEGYVEMVNDAHVEQYGYAREALVGAHVSEFVSDEAARRGSEFIADFIRSGGPRRATFEFEGVTTDGETRIAEVNLAVLTDEDGSFDGSTGVVRDVTDRREHFLELNQYRTLVETVADPMYRLDEEGTLQMVNRAMTELTDLSREELLGTHISEHLRLPDIETGDELIRELLHGNDRVWATYEFTIDDPHGDTRTFEDSLTVLTDEGGSYAGSVGVVRDVTERKARERELAQYETIIETAPLGLFVLDEDGRFIWANEEYKETMALSEEVLEGKEFLELVRRGYHDQELVEKYTDIVRELLSSSSDTEEAVHVSRTRTPRGEVRWDEVHHSLLPLEDGEYRGTVSIFREITEQREYKREIERQNERLQRFASLVSHDLRNPLTVAKGYLELATSTDGEPDALEKVGDSLDRMEEIIADLLDLARYGEAVSETDAVQLASAAADAWGTVETADATFECTTEATIGADRPRLQQLLENLFRNAVEHAGEDVTVTVGDLPDESGPASGGIRTSVASAASEDDRSESTGGPADEVEEPPGQGRSPGGFYVADDGPGIPEDRKDEAFELGYTTDERGTGFGLGIVQAIAEAHGWDVCVTDAEGGGARFEVTGVTVE